MMKNIMEYKGYYTKINYEEETSTFYGKIENINGLVSFEASTIEGLRKEFENAVIEHLDFCKKHNMNPDKPYKGSFNVRITPKLHQEAVVLAAAERISLNQFVERAIRDKVNSK